MKKLACFHAILIIFIIFHASQARADERTVIGLNLPLTTGVCYEKENAANQSWIFSGLLATDSSLVNYDISFTCYAGKRFYRGNTAGRSYIGIYGSGSFTYIEPDDSKTHLGVIGVLGYEWRFGSSQNARLFIEAGGVEKYSKPGFWSTEPVFGAGIGFNI